MGRQNHRMLPSHTRRTIPFREFGQKTPFCKKQQMQWTKRGAHLLLQARVKTLNQELGMVFQRWYPDLQLEEEPLAA